jgi:hypothetical protein
MIVVVVDVVHILLGFRTIVPLMSSVATHFTSHAGIIDVHDLFLLTNSVLKLLHQQVHLGR